MINLPSTALAALLALAGAAFAQDSGQAPDAGGVDQPPADLYQGPIVGGKKIQPTQSEIMDRLMLQREEQPGGAAGGPPPQQKDKELDELYDQLLQQSGPGSSTGQ